MQCVPYLFFAGNCADAFALYKTVFGAEYAECNTYADAPEDMKEEMGVHEGNKDQIMHVSLNLPDGGSIMGSDMLNTERNVGNHMVVSCNLPDRESADRVCMALREGGAITMPLQETFWQSYFGMVKDQYGIQWMLHAPLKP